MPLPGPPDASHGGSHVPRGSLTPRSSAGQQTSYPKAQTPQQLRFHHHQANINPQHRASPAAANMGNGASAAQVVLDGEPLDVARLKSLLPELKHQLKQRDAELERCQLELERCQNLLHERDADISRLKNEIHKLKSVLQATVHKDGKPDILSTIHDEAVGKSRAKKQGVSGESTAQSSWTAELKRHEKDFR